MKSAHPESQRIELLATVAHELRNPIAAIQYAVRVLELSNQTASTLEQARAVIDRQVSRIARISDDLLTAGFMSTGKLELRKRRTDLRGVVQSAVEGCQAHIEGKHHTLALQFPAIPVEAHVDPIRITQVVANLVDNAVKYSDPFSSIVVCVECSSSKATIRVADNGMGIAPDFLPRIFDLFAQCDQARLRSTGLGIGLNLVKRLVELHDGTVEATSAGLGMGSTFTVSLPNKM